MRTIARSSSNRKSASALASSVLPTPVGPRNRNEPVGRSGSAMPARERRTASETALDRGPLADQPLADHVLHAQQLGGLALEQPAGGDAGPGLDHVGDLLGTDLLADHRVGDRLLGLRGLLELLLELGDPAVQDLAGPGQVAVARAAARPACAARRSACAARRRPRARPSRAPTGPPARAAPPRGRRGRRAAARAGPSDAASSSRSSASSSIFIRSTERRSWSISTGEDSISMRSRDADSSTRSIALSGSWRPVM